MAWFHHGLQDAKQPQLSSLKNLATNSHMRLESNLKPQASSEDWPHPPQSSIPDLPRVSQDSGPQSLGKPTCMSSLNLRVSDDPEPLSYVTLQEQRCVLSWFLGWGPPQRERFLQDLISKAVPGKVSSLLEQLNTLQVKDRPPNIFECQLRLWTQWFESWNEGERNAFLSSLEESDAIFVAQFYRALASTAGRD
ncbi:hypothetical protein P4O66_017055 [Electrophorus voltai]|uniref:Uncharacterized protein n=3 Tax=Electrophorus TaxID=8004 RepID=A0A4W4GTD3_ELEEL|nr:uncharacterized protein C14orf119 homolog isoform X2 [Electrophorus electricus]XP_035391906.1 uncharacterized protein C14orf119 homolog isoform X2 [Electrophorus electricus]KAK1787192.1 hypothetical protein P4O66_017055 [Electrophorus voltai]